VKRIALWAGPAAAVPAAGAEYTGSAVCAGCHAEIAKRYAGTPMARSSGATSEIPAGEFEHRQAGAVYSMRGREMAYRKQEIAGARELPYFLGAGVIARSFLIDAGGFLFQAPVTYYTAAQRWDASPGYQETTTIALNRPVEPECLACHAGRLQPEPATQNGYRGRPFLESGIGCERCHGPGSEHARLAGKGAIVHPAKLEARRRDSICAECHLGGLVRIFREGREPGDFTPGEPLHQVMAVFLPSSGHMEQLWESACKKASGDKLWCGACHDSHGAPTDYRQKCAECHERDGCGRGPDCVRCHMPKTAAAAIPHAAYSDHTIPRRPGTRPEGELSPDTIRPFWSDGVGSREVGLALVKAGIQRGKIELFGKAFEILRPLEERLDAEGLLHLAVLYDQRGEQERAESLYRRVLPRSGEAAVNLGAILAARGEVEEAMELWKEALRRNPGLEAASIKLASAQLLRGDAEAARETLRKARWFVPDLR